MSYEKPSPDDLVAMHTLAHVDSILQEFGVAAWVVQSTMENIRNRLIEHLEIAEKRGREETR